ncbi:serine/threonine protein kinase [Streptomyces sp. NBC_00868]|uniref:serine/threonine-protein kinase n=1 Tax=unclassified Streptomyces TaxID=2593676 RepID=UPI0032445FF6|nr:serine/threonine protein kinase [Streptomyces sp. NBC_00868]
MERGELIAGRYELEKRLGRGGMGEVWAGRDRMLHRDVAVKMLVLDDAVHADLPRRFEREAVAAAQISHPNVVALYDRGVHEDLWFLVMERVEGANLAEHIRQESPMDVGRALEIAQEICAALVAAHRAQVIHYDIKPHNVMLASDGRVKVVDFGIAGFIQTAFTLAHSSQLAPAGTPEYGAPEQFLAERGDARSDLYALGSVLFALLTGRPPFTGQTGLAIMHHKLAEDAPSLGTLRPELPPAVIQLVAELLQRDPGLRPQTAEAVHGRLAQLRTALGSSNATTVTRVPPFITTRPPTQRLPAHDGPFEISWTPRDRIADDASRSFVRSSYLLRVVVVLAVVTGISFYFLLEMGSFQRETGVKPGAGEVVVMVPFMIGALCTVVLLPYLVANAVHWRRELRHWYPWSLSIDRHGIATTDVSLRMVGWDKIQMVTVEAIRSKAPYLSTGLHIRFVHDGYSFPGPPAGWTHPRGIRRRADRWIPVCVLSPMTAQQQADLEGALTRYAGPRWQPEVDH